MYKDLFPNEKLLLCYLKSSIDNYSQDFIKSLIKENINWGALIIKAKTLSIAPNLYLWLKKIGMQVPHEVRKELYEIYSQNLVRSMKLWGALKRILNLFYQAKIDAVPLKGPFFSDDIYGHIGSRIITDLDILIHKEDFARAKKELAKIGYAPVKGPCSEEFIMDFLRHMPFVHKDGHSSLNPVVEIHWNFYPWRPSEFNMTPVWKTAIPRDIENTHFLSLSHAYTLIYLAVTLRIHGYLNFRHFCDIDALITNFREKIDWEYVMKLATIHKQRVALFYALSLTRELLDTDVPDDILKKIKPFWLQHKLIAFFVHPKKILFGDKGQHDLFYSDFVNLLSVDSLYDALKVIYELFFSRSEYLAARYEENFFPGRPQRPPVRGRLNLLRAVIRSLFHVIKKGRQSL